MQAANDPAYWATRLIPIKLQADEFSFKNHEYQIEPMRSQAKRMCCRKATGGGWTELKVLMTLHGMIHGRYPLGAMYLFPTDTHVDDFSKTRFKPLITRNPLSIGRWVKSGGKGTDTNRVKQIGNSMLLLFGARMTDGDSGNLRSHHVDMIVGDEIDLFDEGAWDMAHGRIRHSAVQEECCLSNPTLPNVGIDAQFALSDQRHWFRMCGCGHETCAELSFPGCVKEYPDGRGYIACSHCGKPLPIYPGGWRAQVPSNSGYMHGYQWSHLTSVFNDPMDVLRDFNNPPNGNLGRVMKDRLGLPYVDSTCKLDIGTVRQCCGNDMMADRDDGPNVMGVDIGDVKHVVVGRRIDRERYEILHVAQVASMNDVHDLGRRFNVRVAVIDARPEGELVRQFQKAEPYRVWRNQYLDNSIVDADYSDVMGIVKVDRTYMCDKTHRLLSDQKTVLPRRCPAVDTFIAQVCNIAKTLETNEKTGAQVYRYKYAGPKSLGDHYRHAMNYFVLAADKSKIVSTYRRGENRPTRSECDLQLV